MILFLTHADTEILGLRVVSESLPAGFPELRAAKPPASGHRVDLDGAELVVARLLGGSRSFDGLEGLLAECAARGVPIACFGGEATPDEGLMERSSLPRGVLERAFEYLVEGGTRNLEQLLRYLADTVLGCSFGSSPPERIPEAGILGEPVVDASRPTVGVVFYRAHYLTGNTTFVSDLCAAIEARGANAVAVYCYSLRDAPGRQEPGAAALLASYGVAAVVTTVLASGSFSPEAPAAGRPGAEGFSEEVLGSLGVPVVQAIASTSSAAAWSASSGGLAPLDVAWGVALPELDGRIISVPFSFKEVVDDGDELGSPVLAYRTLPDRTERVAGLAVRLASLRPRPASERRVAVVLSAYPTRRSRLGNAVGLDTPRSLVELLGRLAAAGYGVSRLFESGDALMGELAGGFDYESPVLTGEQLERAAGRLAVPRYLSWFSSQPASLRDEMVESWGEPPGSVGLSPARDELVFSGLDLGGVLLAIQPPRAFGDDPIALYHSPVLPPTHHYLAFYLWLAEGFGADAVVHLGKHGTLEWLPGKGVGLSATCYPDVALGDLPLVYPFVVNDPGEGAQAKRRAHAVVVDHLVPPLTRADTYDDTARLERLLDEHAQIAALDPAKLPAIRRQVWDLLVEAEVHRDLGLERRYGSGGPDAGDDARFDELVLEVDGYLCELKDAQIRGGLHVLGRPPEGEALVDFVLALTRLPQGRVPSLRGAVAAAELGIEALATASRRELDAVEARCRELVEEVAAAGWRLPGGLRGGAAGATLAWVCDWLVPALRSTTAETASVLGALDGRHVPPGPSGAPSRGMAHVLPTGRNFYSLDPKAVPSRLSMEVGQQLASRLIERHLSETGRLPRSVAIAVWGTSTMRTGGDDIAEALALIGVRPRWAEETARVEGLEVVPLGELGRPRVDVTLRISGLFRDAFPHVVALFDEAVGLVSNLDEPASENPLKAVGPSEPRIFGPAPGSYGSGVLPVIESGAWRSGDDLASVYLARSSFSYGRSGMGVAAGDALRRRLAASEVAVKNQDNREHDIFDSDDYLQDHGGMVAAIRLLRNGEAPLAVFGDSSDPARPRVRSLAEEAARVVRSRVLNPKWIEAMKRHGYKGAFEMAATVDYLFGYDATAGVVEDWMYERVTAAYVGDAGVRKFFEESNPWALRAIAERLLEAAEREMWAASQTALATLRDAVLEGEGYEEDM